MPNITRMINLIERMARRLYRSNNEKTEKILEWTIRKIRLQTNAHRKDNKVIYRGEIFWCDLGENIGSEESKRRPVVIVQNQKGNNNSPTTIIAPITNATINLPIAVPINREENPDITGTVDLGQIKVIHKARLIGNSIGKLTTSELKKIDIALMKSVGTFGHLIREQKKYQQKDQYSKELNRILRETRKELGIQKNEDIIKQIKTLKQ